jgi:amidase
MGEPMLGMAYEFGLTRTVRDAAHLLDAVQGPGVGDKYTAPPPRGRYADELGIEPGPLRVAVSTEAWSGASVDPQVAAAAVQVGRTLEQMGHAVAEDRPVLDWDAVIHCMTATAVAIASTVLEAPRQPDPDRLEAVSRRLLRVAKDYSALDMMAAFSAQNRVTRSVGTFFTEYDLLVTPTLGRLPAPHGTLRYDDPDHTLDSWLRSIFDYGPFTKVFNISGQPAISLPLGQGDGGLPIGVQLVAPYGREDLLFQVAAQLEQAMPWKHRIPGTGLGQRPR